MASLDEQKVLHDLRNIMRHIGASSSSPEARAAQISQAADYMGRWAKKQISESTTPAVPKQVRVRPTWAWTGSRNAICSYKASGKGSGRTAEKKQKERALALQNSPLDLGDVFDEGAVVAIDPKHTLQKLPQNVLLMIVKNLDKNGLICFGLQCKAFYAVYRKFHGKYPYNIRYSYGLIDRGPKMGPRFDDWKGFDDFAGVADIRRCNTSWGGIIAMERRFHYVKLEELTEEQIQEGLRAGGKWAFGKVSYRRVQWYSTEVGLKRMFEES